MAKKDFSAMLDNSVEQKREVNLKIENQMLKDTIKGLQQKLGDDFNNISVLTLPEINLRNNIRDHYEFEQIQELAEDISANGQLQPVLITEDNFLIAGYRRYFALKHLSSDSEILVNRLKRMNHEIDEDELKEIQFAENNQRRNIDNFQLCNLLTWYLEKGYTQKDLSEKFKKSKGVISVILGIKNLDNVLVEYFKQFQIYGVSQKKFVDTNSEQQQKFLDRREIIGYRPLYNIAKLSKKEQKKAFLKTYYNRLTDEEIFSDYFRKEAKELQKETGKTRYEKAMKSIDHLKELVDKVKENISDEDYEDFSAATNYLLELEHIFIKNAEKI